ncbi:MAG: SDR family oxidoreductase [Candidatus Omnitrophica bacterium]|nr:SDR family oxidoreductase [Candidatus Omnitrophota bacterium]
MADKIKNVFITGGAGYVGAVLVPKLLKAGYNVKVLDLYIYGDVLAAVKGHPGLTEVKGDMRDVSLLEKIIPGTDAVIHLACISNDPSFELDPTLGKSINYDAFIPLVQISRKNNVKRFIYASSSSVYGVKDTDNVTEEMSLEPLTDYSKYKALCEEYLLPQQTKEFTTLILRPATVCGYSPRQRLDLAVNILSNHGFHHRKIKVFGGTQKRPNIHIEDITDLYVKCLEYPKEKIAGKIFNVGYENHTLHQLAGIVKDVVNDPKMVIVTEPTDDNRSYHVSSAKISRELGFVPAHTIEDAVKDLVKAFEDGKLPEAMTREAYYNIRVMKTLNLK